MTDDTHGTEPQQSSSSGAVVTLTGDATGPSNSNTVVAVQHFPYSNASPTVGQVNAWNGTAYAPSNPSATNLTYPGLTLFAAPLVGEVGYLSSANTLSRADAGFSVSSNVYGVYAGVSGSVITEGKAMALFEPGLTLLPNQFIYLSLTPGRVTNVQPSVPGQSIVFLGTLPDPTGYVSLTGSALSVSFNPEIPIFIV